MADEKYKPRPEEDMPQIPWYYPQEPDSPCINMTDEEFGAYIRQKRKEFEDPTTHCRHGYKLENFCYQCKKLAGEVK